MVNIYILVDLPNNLTKKEGVMYKRTLAGISRWYIDLPCEVMDESRIKYNMHKTTDEKTEADKERLKLADVVIFYEPWLNKREVKAVREMANSLGVREIVVDKAISVIFDSALTENPVSYRIVNEWNKAVRRLRESGKDLSKIRIVEKY